MPDFRFNQPSIEVDSGYTTGTITPSDGTITPSDGYLKENTSTRTSEISLKPYGHFNEVEDLVAAGTIKPSDGKSTNEVENLVFGGISTLLMILGLAGNVHSFIYFLRKGKRSPGIFYMIISGIDIGISFCAVPVIASLLTGRSATMLKSPVICKSWSVLMNILVKVSMFMVMVLNIFRTIALAYPFYCIRKHDKKVIPGVLVYLAVLLVIDLIYLITGENFIRFSEVTSFCVLHPGAARPGTTYTNIYSCLMQAEVLFPSIVVLVCFVVTTTTLVRSRKNQIESDERTKENRMITVTITIFTAVFLICNLPRFVEQVLYLATRFSVETFKQHITSNLKLWVKYGHFSTIFLLSLLNAALNPCLYMARMPQFRVWLKEESDRFKLKFSISAT